VWDATSGQELLTLKGHTDTVFGVAFNPDGQRLASGSGDYTVKVWDATSGQELLTLKGHTGRVYSVAFSPDGRRLASVGGGNVKVWDVFSGQELLTLKENTHAVNSVAFSPDGRRLASAIVDKAVNVWETAAVPAAVLRQRGLVSDVHSLFDELLLREEVLAALRKDPMLSKTDREFALQVAETTENSGQLSEAAWNVVKANYYEGKDAYALPLRRAEAAVRQAPGIGDILTTLGVAQYRTRRYAEALATLTKSEKLNATKIGLQPADLAFLAMAQHQLGKKEEANATLARLREVMKQPRWAKDPESQGFLREAEELIAAKPVMQATTYLYFALAAEKRIVIYEKDSKQGTLTPRGDIKLDDGEPGALTVDPKRQFLFASLRSTGKLAAFRIDRDSGKLMHLNTVATGPDPAHLATDATGRFLFAAYYVDGKVTVHAIGADGRLSDKPVQSNPTADKAHAIVPNPSNRFVFVPHTGANAIF
jgi:hypothetical protein